MQIILVQSEVEQAIRDYIGKTVTIPQGTDISIDLTATRGSEGVKAVIDLVPSAPASGRQSAGTKKATAAIPTALKQEQAKASETTKVTEPETTTPVDASESTQDEATSSEPADDVTNSDEGAGDDPGEEEAPAEAPAPATPPVKSLFANLRKPQNAT